jgi:hypothetical protein
MIEKLTKKQEIKLSEYRQRYLNQATSTERSDRKRAEVAARRLAELGGMKINEVFWVDSLEEGREKYDSLRDLFRDSLWNSLGNSLWDSLRDSPRGSPKGSFMDSLRESLMNSLMDSFWDTESVSFATFAVEELGIEIGEKEREKLYLVNEILASCFAVWVVVPGVVILCDRPRSVDVQDGRLISMEW